MMIERMIKSFSRKRALPVLVGNNELHPTPPYIILLLPNKTGNGKRVLKGPLLPYTDDDDGELDWEDDCDGNENYSDSKHQNFQVKD